MIYGGIFDVEKKEKEIIEIEKKMKETDFWDDAEKAKKLSKKFHELKGWVDPLKHLKKDIQSWRDLYKDLSTEKEFLEEMSLEIEKIEKKLSELEVRKMLSKEMDDKDCYLSINAGAGGTEACDWVSMLFRMYQRWIQKKGWKMEVIDRIEGDVAGIKSITLKVEGPFAYGYAKAEKGVHRLIRISPFDSSGRRHTSFASVDVAPAVDEDIEIDISSDEIKVDTYRASGPGGQHVNVTDSAVRITHLPTKIVVSCQKERSQKQNRDTCMKMLKSKLYEREVLKREEKLKKIGGEKKKIEWGSQIRSYVFQPYTLVKDVRTNYESGNIQKIMEGGLDDFINAYLKKYG